jgi:hypothetical protein
MKKMLAAVLVTACGLSYQTTTASAAPANATMLAPGVYTTADISRRCQAYINRRLPQTTGAVDRDRQSVFIACVQKLYNEQYGAAPATTTVAPVAAAPIGAMTGYYEAPVSLTTPGSMGPFGYGCSTDEGYGRRGNCSTF